MLLAPDPPRVPLAHSPDGRVEGVGVLRAVVSLGILIRHFSTGSGFAQQWPWWAEFGVPWVPASECFLVVSGYFLAHNFRPGHGQFFSVREFARRRGYRLLVPYLVALGLAYVGLAVWRVFVPGPVAEGMFSPLAVLANALCVPDLFSAPTPMLFFWTVVTLVQVNATWAAAFWCVRQVFLLRGRADYHYQTKRVMIVLTGGVLVAGGVLTWTDWLPPGEWQLPRWSAYPATGAFAYWVARGRLKVWVFPLLLAFLGVGAGLTDSPRPLYGGVTAVFLVTAGRGLLTPTGPLTRLMALSGNWSYSTYLMHGLVGVRVWAVLAVFGITPRTPALAVLLLTVAVAASLAAGWLLYVLVERPMSRRAAAVDYRR